MIPKTQPPRNASFENMNLKAIESIFLSVNYLLSHELHEPLMTLKGCISFLSKKYTKAMDSRGRKTLNFAQSSVKRMDA